MIAAVILMIGLTWRDVNSNGCHRRLHFGNVITKNAPCCFTSSEIPGFPIIFNLVDGIIIFFAPVNTLLCVIRTWRYNMLSYKYLQVYLSSYLCGCIWTDTGTDVRSSPLQSSDGIGISIIVAGSGVQPIRHQDCASDNALNPRYQYWLLPAVREGNESDISSGHPR